MTPSASKKHDISLLNRTLFRLALPRLIFRTIVVLLCLSIGYWLAQQVLAFGAKQDYAFLSGYSPQVTDYLNSINKYIWWGVILLGAVILYCILSSWIENSIKRAGQRSPNETVIETLLLNLSPDAKNVLAWVWKDQREPITLKDLYETRHQLKSGRTQRLAQVERQRQLLGLSPLALEEQNHLIQEQQKVENLLQDIDLDLKED